MNDPIKLKEYVINTFRNKRTKKPFGVYINIANSYDEYPETIKDIVINLYSIGYWKDYLLLLLASNNLELNNFIYNYLVDTLKQDIKNDKLGENISTLAKWLPRENSKFNKKLDFVNKFNSIMYPNIKNRIHAHKMYRLTITDLNKKLGTGEIKLCEKKYDEIDFEKLSPICFKNNYKKFLQHDQCKENMKNYLLKTTSQLNLYNFIRKIFLQDLDDFMKNIYKEVYNNNLVTYYMDLPFDKTLLEKNNLYVDLSALMFKDHKIIAVIGACLLKSELDNNDNTNNTCIYILCNNPYKLTLSGDIFNKINTIINSCNPVKKVDITPNSIVVTVIENMVNYNNGPNIFFWVINNGITSTNNTIMWDPICKPNKTKEIVGKILDESTELYSSVIINAIIKLLVICYILFVLLTPIFGFIF